jgi:hypothetical protein
MGWANRSGPGHPEYRAGAVDQGWNLLELFGTDLVAQGSLLGTVGSILLIAPDIHLVP